MLVGNPGGDLAEAEPESRACEIAPDKLNSFGFWHSRLSQAARWRTRSKRIPRGPGENGIVYWWNMAERLREGSAADRNRRSGWIVATIGGDADSRRNHVEIVAGIATRLRPFDIRNSSARNSHPVIPAVH